ncbi:MAG: peptide deformylase [Actinomycetaceae bacterium]|nr:peptide deformylase [Actinomycetaceae bacterium]
MAQREIRVIGDPILRTVCDPVTEITDGVRKTIADLLENVQQPGRAGLSANQIGASIRAFAWNIDGNVGYIINPEIVEISDEDFQDGEEGCLSVPDLWFPCKRSNYAKAEGIDLDGKKVVIEGTEIWARLIQHEIDHLNGKLYIDRLDRVNRRKALQATRDL